MGTSSLVFLLLSVSANVFFCGRSLLLMLLTLRMPKRCWVDSNIVLIKSIRLGLRFLVLL
ncbi:TPA_asm: Alt [Abeoforma parvovirus]|nr:TPA_asm: Alt [Abeoforma parvovirus]